MQEADQLKLELQDIDKEMKNTDDQITSLKDKISRDEKQQEQLTQASTTAKVTIRDILYYMMCSWTVLIIIITDLYGAFRSKDTEALDAAQED